MARERYGPKILKAYNRHCREWFHKLVIGNESFLVVTPVQPTPSQHAGQNGQTFHAPVFFLPKKRKKNRANIAVTKTPA